MATATQRPRGQAPADGASGWLHRGASFAHAVLFDAGHRYTRSVLIPAIVLLETVVSYVIVTRVPYTEIDWVAYMQEVEGWMGGELDYSKLKGDTGPLVYPAGFVYLYRALHALTDSGRDIRMAQWLFAALYVAFTALVCALYAEAKPARPWVLLLLCASKRVHSIFMLRCFNDCCAMFLAYVAIWCFVRNRWNTGLLLYSLGVSVKMNVMLFAPPLFALLLLRFGLVRTVPKLLLLCAAPQLVLGAPFLLAYPWAYLKGSFDLGRVFFFRWTVNLKFLPEHVFLDRRLHVALLVLHLALLAVFAVKLYRNYARSTDAVALAAARADGDGDANLSPLHITSWLFVGNAVGVVCARSLHYQFYVWYFHQLPALLWLAAPLPTPLRLAMLAAVEWVWNVYPATPVSSLVLVACHVLLLVGLLVGRGPLAAPRPATAARPHAE